MNPLTEYESRRAYWREERQSLERLFVHIGNWRLTLGLTEAILAWLVLGGQHLPGWILLIPAAPFVGLVAWHARVIRRRTRADRAIRFYASRLARVTGDWVGTGPSGDSFRSPDHVYADDLDLFGRGSLFELLSTCRLRSGERLLADWLLAPAAIETVRDRQAAVRELAQRFELREEAALLGEDIRAELQAEALGRWGAMPPIPFPPGSRLLTPSLALASVVTLVSALAGWLPLWPFVAVLACDLWLGFVCRKAVAQVTGTIETPGESLRLLSLLLALLESQQFTAPLLRQLRSRLEADGSPASLRIARLERRLDWLASSDHLLVRIVAPLLLWREQVAFAIECWRRENGVAVAQWVAGAAEFEALSSLGTLHFERPGWCFPHLLPSAAAHFEAEALQHPLLSPTGCVPNDLALTPARRLLIVSGSNMSGKSTLLRAVGLNAVLAWAGAPVAAARLVISPVQVGASLRVADSLQDNKSRFLAEILRLRQIIGLTGEGPTVLFLLDELLSGTNSHDRTIGASGIVERLLEARAAGLITTHDLALARIEERVGSTAANVHFEDHLSNGHITFDYRLHAGVVTRSNALELMRAVGLKV